MANQPRSFGGAGDMFQDMRRQMDRFFSNLQNSMPSFPFGGGTPDITQGGNLTERSPDIGSVIGTPIADVTEQDDSYQIMLEMPGFEQKQIEITSRANTLIVRAERQSQQEQKGQNFLTRERSYGVIQRTFGIPDDVDRDRIGAEYKNGLLTLTLPKSEQARSQSRRIEVKG